MYDICSTNQHFLITNSTFKISVTSHELDELVSSGLINAVKRV